VDREVVAGADAPARRRVAAYASPWSEAMNASASRATPTWSASLPTARHHMRLETIRAVSDTAAVSPPPVAAWPGGTARRGEPLLHHGAGHDPPCTSCVSST